MKHLLILLLCLPLAAQSQNTPVHIPTNTVGRVQGGVQVSQIFIAPILPTAAVSDLLSNKYSTAPNVISNQGAITVTAAGLNWYFNGWQTAATVDYVNTAISAATNGAMPAVFVSSATTLSMSWGGDYFFSGTTATYTLPAISSADRGRAKSITIKNRGTGNLVVNTAGGSNVLYTDQLTNTITVGPGESYIFMPDGQLINLE